MQTNREALLGLAERCWKAEGPDRELDRAIAPIIGIRVVDEGHPLGRCYYDENGHGVPLPLFTASIDAAMTLVPDAYRLTSLAEYGQGLGRLVGKWGCVLVPRNLEGLDTFEKQFATMADAKAATPALALCAAALKARAQKEPDHG